MEITGTAGTPAAPETGAAAARKTLTGDFDNFLTLLTTQLSQQDPLDPVDSNEFVAQLVSFTSVEQAVATNANLESLIALMQSNQTASAVGFLGKTVEASGDTIALADGQARFGYALPQAVESTAILISDSAGEVVATAEGATDAGTHDFTWDGRDRSGRPLPDGAYTISVSARDADGVLVPVTTRIEGRVDGVDTAGDEPALLIDGRRVPLADVSAVREPTL